MSSTNTRGRGRPSVDSERIDIRFLRDRIGMIDRYIAEKRPGSTRQEAVRIIVDMWLCENGYFDDPDAIEIDT
jgi:hypothetical protein